MTETYNILKQAQEDLKYLNRWDMGDFCVALFSTTYQMYLNTRKYAQPLETRDSNPHYQYLMTKWEHFSSDKMGFIWACSYDKLELMAKAIDEMKGDE